MEETVLMMLRSRLDEPPHEKDFYLSELIAGVVTELREENGIHVKDSPQDIMFVTDICAWRYSNRDKQEEMPRWLKEMLKGRYMQEVRDAAE